MQKVQRIPKILTKAFLGDPFMQWLFPGSDHSEKLEKWWIFITEANSANSNSRLDVDDKNTTAAIWEKPKFEIPTGNKKEEENESTFGQFLLGLVGDRINDVVEVLREVNAEHPKEPHWYLQAVGTDPSKQGQGKGAAMLKPVLEICDEQGLGAYLESSNPRNLSFYYRLGFEITKDLVLDEGKAQLTCMWRSPMSTQV